MKIIMNIAVAILLAVILYLVFFGFSPKAEVVTPEIKRTGNYERPVKDGNCYLQKDSIGNQIKVCG